MRSFGVRLPILAATAWAGIGLSVSAKGYSATARLSTSHPRWQQSLCRLLMSPRSYVLRPLTAFPAISRPLTSRSPSRWRQQLCHDRLRVRRGSSAGSGSSKTGRRQLRDHLSPDELLLADLLRNFLSSTYFPTVYTPTIYSAHRLRIPGSLQAHVYGTHRLRLRSRYGALATVSPDCEQVRLPSPPRSCLAVTRLRRRPIRLPARTVAHREARASRQIDPDVRFLRQWTAARTSPPCSTRSRIAAQAAPDTPRADSPPEAARSRQREQRTALQRRTSARDRPQHKHRCQGPGQPHAGAPVSAGR